MSDRPETMRAVEITEPGGPEVLRLCERPVPNPGADEVLVRVAYAGVNGPDIHQRRGSYRAPPHASDLPGLEASGHVAAVGPGVVGLAVGDAVTGLFPGGAYAEYAVTLAEHCLPVPDGMSLDMAAGLPETFSTVWTNVFMAGGLEAGQTFLVHGGTGGIGTTAIQLANRFGARVFATAGTDEKVRLCEKLGAERGINYKTEDFVEVLREAGRADLILDIVGGDYLPRNLKALKDDGRLQIIALQAGSRAEIRFGEVMLRRLTISGSTLRPQSDLKKARIVDALRAQVWPMLDTGQIAPVMDSEFPLADAAEAHRRMESPEHIGKIVLKVS